MESLSNVSKSKMPWYNHLLLYIIVFLVGICAGFPLGYKEGIANSKEIVHEIVEKSMDGTVIQGHMPW